MNVLHTLLKVSFVPLTAGDDVFSVPVTKGKGNKVKVVSRQLLRFRLTITYDNEAGDAEREHAAQAFLSMVGIHSLEAAWTYLFSTVQLVPFVVSESGASSLAVRSPQRPTPVRRASSPPPSPAPRLLTNIGNNFVFGTPVFWSNHTYTHVEQRAEARDNAYGSLRGSSPTGTFTSTTLPLFSHLQASMPYVTTTASPSFSNSGNVDQTPRGNRGSLSDTAAGGNSDVRCEVIGTVQTVAADAGGPRVVGAASGGGGVALPRLLESSFTVELALPDLEASALRGMDTTLAMVVLLPLTFECSRIGAPVDPDQPSILRSVLARSLGQTHVETAASAALVLGSGVVPVELTEPLLCLSSTSPLSNDRLVLNLSLTNVTASAARLYSTSLDLHSSCVLNDADTAAGGAALPAEAAASHFTASPLWGELRPGADLSSMRTIDLLTKLVTITPVLVGEERPPFILHPGETYSFEFVIEVLPQLCYLLNSQSLEYVYARYYAVPHGTTSRPRLDGGAAGGDDAAHGASSRGVAATVFSNGSVVTDCYGEVVSASELRGLLSYSYVSYLFVYYDLMTDGDAAPSHSGEVKGETARRPHVVGQPNGAGLYLRYPAQWSFGA